MDRGVGEVMIDIKLNARAARIKAATAALYGEWGGQTKMAARVGISKQMLSFIIHGDRRVTDKVDNAVTAALAREADRLYATARKLEEMAGTVRQRRPNWQENWNEQRPQPMAGRTTA
jgi:transcriptional regulator with XRE-family HTH domain